MSSHHHQPRPHNDGVYRLADDSPRATYATVDKVTELFKQLHGLIDHSLSSVDKAKKTISAGTVLTASVVTAAEKHLSSAAGDLDRMSELVHAAMQSQAHSIGSPHLAKARPVTLGEAVQHAVDVCRPLAERHQVTLTCEVSVSLADQPAGAVYTVALNAVQNAVEAVARRNAASTAPSPGRVEVELRHDAPPKDAAYGRDDRAWCTLEVRDDGVGLPKGVDASRVFDLGFTTKVHGAGVGLSVAKSVVQGMGGVIELLPRVVVRRVEHGAGGENTACPGCVLRVRFPVVSTGAKRLSA
jgi:signal transduction histidine kinase